MDLAEKGEWKSFLLCNVCVAVIVASILLLQNEAESSSVVDPRVQLVTRSEGLCHIVDGGSDCSFSQVENIIGITSCFLYSLGEGGEEEGVAPMLAKGLDEGVVIDSDISEEYLPPIPAS